MERVYVKVQDYYILYLFDGATKEWIGSCQVGDKLYMSNDVKFDGIDDANPKYIQDIYTNKIYNSRVEFDENIMTIYTEIPAFNRFIIVELSEKTVLHIDTELIKNMQFSIKYLDEKALNNEERLDNVEKDLVGTNETLSEFKEIFDQGQELIKKNTDNIKKLKKKYFLLNEKTTQLLDRDTESDPRPDAELAKINVKIIFTKTGGIQLIASPKYVDKFNQFMDKIWERFAQMDIKLESEGELTCAKNLGQHETIIGTFSYYYSSLPDMLEDGRLWKQNEIYFPFTTEIFDKIYGTELFLYDAELKELVKESTFTFGSQIKNIVTYLTDEKAEPSFKRHLFHKTGSIQIGYLSINRVPLKKLILEDDWTSMEHRIYSEEEILDDSGKVIGYYV